MIKIINGSVVDQEVDAIVNVANSRLSVGGGVCGAIFKRAGILKHTDTYKRIKTPLNDGEAVITPAFKIKNTHSIIHAAGPNFAKTPNAFKELYNSLMILKENSYHSIAFPIISSRIFVNKEILRKRIIGNGLKKGLHSC